VNALEPPLDEATDRESNLAEKGLNNALKRFALSELLVGWATTQDAGV
jgi:hypothetical protein